jgi:hypothetical protein
MLYTENDATRLSRLALHHTCITWLKYSTVRVYTAMFGGSSLYQAKFVMKMFDLRTIV